MKKVSLMLGALALVLGISQCKKQESPVQAGEKQYIEVTASNGNDGSKVNVDFTSVPTVMNLTWEEGDEITVSGGAVGTLTLDDGAGTAQGHFSGEIEKMNDNELVFSYKKAVQERGDENPNLPDFSAQDGTETWIENTLYLETKAAYNDNGKYSLLMEMPYAVLKLDLSALVDTENDVTIKVGNVPVVTFENLAKADAEEMFVALPADGTEQTYAFIGIWVVNKMWTLASSTYYTAEGGNAVAIVPDMKFTVDANGTKVEFAPGNLYWDGSEFHFETSQTAYTTSWDASHVDRFLWSPDKDVAVGTSTSVSGTTSDVFFTNATTTTPKTDFSVDGETGTWRTLTSSEWRYLLYSGRQDVNRFAKAKVSGVKGLLLFPDGYNGVEVISGITGVAAVNSRGEAYPTDNIPSDIWTKMESAGVVFLPAAGYRNGTNLSGVGSLGRYWSNCYDNISSAYFTFFDSADVNYLGGNSRSNGQSVRLVR